MVVIRAGNAVVVSHSNVRSGSMSRLVRQWSGELGCFVVMKVRLWVLVRRRQTGLGQAVRLSTPAERVGPAGFNTITAVSRSLHNQQLLAGWPQVMLHKLQCALHGIIGRWLHWVP